MTELLQSTVGRSLTWQYSKNKITSIWNATLSGTNPYSASAADWNKTIQPGQSINFGMTGDKNGSVAEKPTINGAACSSANTGTPTITLSNGQLQGSFSITTAKTTIWQIQEQVNNAWSTIQSGTGTSATFNYTRSPGTYTFRLYNCLATNSGCTYSSPAAITLYPAAAFDSALWRLVSRADRKTLIKDSAGNLVEDLYRATSQHWRITPNAGVASFKLKQEESGQCLSLAGSTAVLNTCGSVGTDVFVDMVRKPSVSQPGVYYLRTATNKCAKPNPIGTPTIGQCDNSASWYIEPVWFGERAQTKQYQINALLLIKPTTNVTDGVHNIFAQGSVPQATIDAAKFSFQTNAKTWLERITDGRVVWNGTTVVANEPIKSMYYDVTSPQTWWQNPITGQNMVWNVATQRFEPAPANFDPTGWAFTGFLPDAKSLPNDVQRFVPRGTYDSVQVFFNGGSVPSGWGWTPGISAQSNYAIWTTVNGGASDPNAWLSTTAPNPTETYIHEMMHGYDSYFGSNGIPLEEGGLHENTFNQYDVFNINGESFIHWYRDIWLGTVIGTDDAYHGYGTRAFALKTLHQYASELPESTVKVTQRTSGKCLSTNDGGSIPGVGAPVVLSSNCSTDASSFVLQTNGLLRHKASGFCVHPAGGTPGVGITLAFWPSCEYLPTLAYNITDGGSIQNTSSNLCVHPIGGSPTPLEGTNLGLFNSCDEERLQFTFDRQ